MTEHDEIAELVSELIAAWNSSDPSRFGRLFSDRADYVSAAGNWIRGRAAIEQLLAAAGFLQVRLEQPPSIRLHDGVGIAVFRWVSQAADAGAPERGGIISLVVLRQDSLWQVDLLQNTHIG